MSLALVLLACGSNEPAAPVDGSHATSHADHMAMMATVRDAMRTELGAAYDAPVPGLSAADKGAGKRLYEVHCMSCHGGTGHGDGPGGVGLPTSPADFSDAFHARYYSDAGRVQIITKGHVEQGMPAFEAALTKDEIVAVYAYIRTFRGE